MKTPDQKSYALDLMRHPSKRIMFGAVTLLVAGFGTCFYSDDDPQQTRDHQIECGTTNIYTPAKDSSILDCED